MHFQQKPVRFSDYLLLMLVVLAAFAIVFVLYVQAEKQIDKANETRFVTIQALHDATHHQ